ncbi:hypothetical protein PG993_015170 [Apiospora rasikravindrae]|uniref:Uncharacterized protein n=1 Tax=Apiospora rasikravindrae TaxID=990691 RepID=A0ABR1RPT0_9PEZI
MSYGYPTSGGGGSGYGSNAYNTSFAPPTTGYDTTGYYASTAAGGSGPLHYSPTPPPPIQDPADAQADIDKALQEGTHTNATNYYSQRGRWLGTETETIDEPRDGRPQLPGRESHWTRNDRRMDVSPHFHGMHTRNYTQHNFNGPQGDIRAWAHYQGTDDNHLSTYDYQAHGVDQPPPQVDANTLGRDRYASESLDRGTAPRGWGLRDETRSRRRKR